MNRGENDLLNECYRRIAEHDASIDWIVVVVCAIVIAVLWMAP